MTELKIAIHDGIEYPAYFIDKQGEITNIKRNVKLLHSINDEGYHKVTLYKNSSRKTFSVHRLVACTFIDNPNNYKIVNHIDGNKSNNSVSNLEWCTSSHNRNHAINSGLANHEHCKKKLKIVELSKEFDSILECSDFLISSNFTQSNRIHVAKSVGQVLNKRKPAYLKFTYIYI